MLHTAPTSLDLDEALAAGRPVPDADWGRDALVVAEDALRRAQRLAMQTWQAAGAPMPDQVRRVLDRPVPSEAVAAAAEEHRNIIPPLVAAARERATLGEMCRALARGAARQHGEQQEEREAGR